MEIQQVYLIDYGLTFSNYDFHSNLSVIPQAKILKWQNLLRKSCT